MALIGISAPHAASADEFNCLFQSRQICSASGCASAPPDTSFITLRPDDDLYGRCGGSKPCDWYPMTITKSGAFFNIDFASGPQGAKMSEDGSTFIEVFTVTNKVVISHGSCE